MSALPTLREEAETLRLGLLAGLTQPEGVIVWADRVIAELDEPPIEVIDLALAGNSTIDELRHLLEQVPGPADLARAAHRHLGLLREYQLAGKLSFEEVASRLHLYYLTANVEEGERLMALHLSIQFDCLVYYGSLEGWQSAVDNFLVRDVPS